MSGRIEEYRVRGTNLTRVRYVCEKGHETYSVPVRDGDTDRAIARVQREVDEVGAGICGYLNCPTRRWRQL